MSREGRRLRYVARVVEIDWGMPIDDLAAAVALRCGQCPNEKQYPFDKLKAWKQAAAELLRDALPEATRAMGMGYVPHLVNYLSRAYFGRWRIDDYFYDTIINQIKAARTVVRMELKLHADRGSDGDSVRNVDQKGLRSDVRAAARRVRTEGR